MICDIDIIRNNVSGIWVMPYKAINPDEAEPMGEFAILHTQMEKWLKSKGYLRWESNSSDHTGQHVQRTGSISYEEFISTNLDAKLIHEYMIDKKLTDLKFEQ